MTSSNPIPQHIAIVMDGNGRWASKRFLPRVAGHKQGVDALRLCVSACVQRGVKVLTVFAFSSENWNRPTEEVSGLMSLFALALSREVPKLKAQGVRLHFIGDRANLSQSVVDGMSKSELETYTNETLVLNVCFNYGGRWDIVQAAAKLMAQGTSVTEQALSSAMALSHVGDPDLVIRTGGEQRISNFLLWQSAYSEFYFSDKLWPDFDEAALDLAIVSYLQRERRFGKTTAQLAGQHDSKASTA
jgi:undecaprenyl diphosphate synthase